MRETLLMRATVLAFSVAVLLSACGGSGKPSVAAGTPGSHPGSTTAPRSATTTGPLPSTSATQTNASNFCRAAELKLSFIGGQGATGHGLLGFELRNVTSRACHTYGFPGIQFLDRNGKPLPTKSTRTTHDFFGSAPLQGLVVSANGTVSFRVGVTHGINSSAGCTTAYGISVIPPDDTSSLRATISQGAYECGTATVSPLRPGGSAYP
jgi:Domain of unknown function (DUF4232)